jgi:very-short-patch-repair endonuclease
MTTQNQPKTTPRVRGTTQEIQSAAWRMRHSPTAAEHALWQILRDRRLGGFRFRRQHPVGPFILDFYCPALKLAVEVDGSSHAQQVERDEARTRQLEVFGYHVLRVRNEDVLGDVDKVRVRILAAAQSLSANKETSE